MPAHRHRHHSHDHPHRERHRRFHEARQRFIGPLHRRLFWWSGATILVTAAVVGFGFWAITDRTDWRRQVDDGARWLGARFAEVWDDPAARDRLATETSSAFGISLVVEDAEGRTLIAAGPACEAFFTSVEVMKRGERVGRVSGCPEHRGKRRGPAAALPFLLALVVLWVAAGALARRIARPLVELARVARELGEGKLESRVRVAAKWPVEAARVGAAVNEMADRIERQLADQKELLAAVSHEMRTPLGHLALLVETAREKGAAGQPLEKTLVGLEREVKEIDLLVGELLASSRLELGRPTRVALSPVELCRDALARQGLDVGLLVVEDAPDAVLGDPTLLGRAVANLLDNAQRHAGGARALVVRGERDASGGLAAVKLEVQDDGAGLPEGEPLFEPFRQGDGGGRRGSLGLGLALVRRIAEAHDGAAYAAHRAEGGAVVGVRIPIRASL